MLCLFYSNYVDSLLHMYAIQGNKVVLYYTVLGNWT